jgi:hypothetical protein
MENHRTKKLLGETVEDPPANMEAGYVVKVEPVTHGASSPALGEPQVSHSGLGLP